MVKVKIYPYRHKLCGPKLRQPTKMPQKAVKVEILQLTRSTMVWTPIGIRTL